jgi:putative two-component system response regulator
MKLKIRGSEAKKVLEELIDAVIDIEMERELPLLPEKILFYARKMVGASAGSLYLLEDKVLKLNVCQNDEVNIHSVIDASNMKGSEISPDHTSIAGYSVASGEAVHVPDVNKIDESLPYRFNSEIDKNSGFISKSILAVPIRHPSDGVIGTLELFNPADGFFKDWNIGALKSFSVLAAVTMVNIRLYDSIKDSYLETVFRLGIVSEFKDENTYEHLQRIRHTSKIIARHLGCSEKEQDSIFHASSMHDIGKIGVPDSVLNKKDKLNDDEWAIMRKHPEMGAKVLENTKSEILQASEQIARYHHEKWNGKGYPEGLAGEQIPQFARIVAVADVFDALVQERSYKSAWKVQKALDFIQGQRGEHFAPEVVDAFFKGIEEILEVQKKFGELHY